MRNLFSSRQNRKYLRIAMVGQKRIPSREGGIEIVVEELSTRMASYGNEVVCYNRKGHHVSGEQFDSNHNDAEYKGVKLKPVFTIDKKGLAAVTSSIIASIRIAFGNYDVVHFHAEGPCAMLWLPKLFGKRCIATIHGLDWSREKWNSGFAAKYIRFGERVAVKWADEIIVLSKGVQDYFKDTYGRETRFVPNGISRPKIVKADMITKQFGLKKDDYILFLGRIVPEKGLRYLVEAFKQVNTDKKLVIAGGASDTNEFIKEIREMAKDDDRILFTGFVQGQMLEELYSNAYVYTLPSDLEGMPISLLEAMSYQNCCLVSDIAECTEVVENKAVVFKKSNVVDLKRRMQMLCDNPEIVKWYKAGASQFVCSKYNWDEVVDETLRLYRDVQRDVEIAREENAYRAK